VADAAKSEYVTYMWTVVHLWSNKQWYLFT